MAYAKLTILSAERYLVRDIGGVKNLAESVVALKDYKNENLYRLCARYVQENVLIYTQDRRDWLARRGIKTKDVNGVFNGIFTNACFDLVTAYMDRHKLRLAKKGYSWVLVKRA